MAEFTCDNHWALTALQLSFWAAHWYWHWSSTDRDAGTWRDEG